MKRPISKMLRGSSWSLDSRFRSAYRNDDHPDGCYSFYGFRIVIGRRNEKTS
jgi:formylglycine-generating enzyme required for sulfatase activity